MSTSSLHPISVTQLLMSIKGTLEQSFTQLSIEGEISNFTRHFKSQHCYFTLKDPQAQIPCVFFKGYAQFCPFEPEDGQKVILQADLTIYPQQGRIQLMVKSMKLAGQGNLQQQFEEIKEKLKNEGLFDSSRKKPFPLYPQSIGILTSATGAVIEDIKKTIQRRAPWIQLYLYPVRVQGDGAAQEIADGIYLWNAPSTKLPTVDILLVGRGGGSLEDLWAFNEEVLARAIASSRLPIISAVGHESDFTIADLVSDRSASTPTAAAEILSPDTNDLRDTLEGIDQFLTKILQQFIDYYSLKLDFYSKGPLSSSPEEFLRDFIQQLDDAELLLKNSVESQIASLTHLLEKLALKTQSLQPSAFISLQEHELVQLEKQFHSLVEKTMSHASSEMEHLAHLFQAISPEAVLNRGFALLKDNQGKLITDSKKLKKDDSIQIITKSYILESTISSIKKKGRKIL